VKGLFFNKPIDSSWLKTTTHGPRRTAQGGKRQLMGKLNNLHQKKFSNPKPNWRIDRYDIHK
jgi:hypothetical protein